MGTNRLQRKVVRPLSLWLVNHPLAGTHFFGAKRMLARAAGFGIGDGTRIVGPLHAGSEASLITGTDCWLGRGLAIEGNGAVTLGSNVDLGPCVTFATGGHDIGCHARRAGFGRTFEQSIGSGCWIGTHALIVGDVSVGDGTVVAAGAVVVRDCEADCLYAGVPAVCKKQLQG